MIRLLCEECGEELGYNSTHFNLIEIKVERCSCFDNEKLILENRINELKNKIEGLEVELYEGESLIEDLRAKIIKIKDLIHED